LCKSDKTAVTNEMRVPARQLARLGKLAAKAFEHKNNAHVVAPAAAAAASLQLVRGQAQAAVLEKATEQLTIPDVVTDLYGAVSPVGAEIEEGVFKNVDGHRFEDGRYKAFQTEIEQFIGQERIYTDPVRTFAYGECCRRALLWCLPQQSSA
jgi:hypothetical protein